MLIKLKTNINIDLYIKNLENQEDYIIKHRDELLPDWLENPQTIIFIFLQCKYPLDGTNLIKEQLEKDRLLLKFNEIGLSFYSICKDQGFLAEIIDSKNGYPQYSQKGAKIFNIPAIVTRYLPDFRRDNDHKCGLIHTWWGKAIYPGIMLSLANKKQVKILMEYCLTFF